MSNDLGTPILEITSPIDTIVVHISKTTIVIMAEEEEEYLTTKIYASCVEKPAILSKVLSSNDISFTGTNNSQPSPGHITKRPDFSNSVPFGGMAAMVAAHPEIDDNCWYSDLGTTNHVTSELGNLSVSSEYTGNNKIHMGNGIGPSISHIGQTSLIPSSLILILALYIFKTFFMFLKLPKISFRYLNFALAIMSFLNFISIPAVSRTNNQANTS